MIHSAANCLMPNHWHLLLWPRHDGELSDILRWITVTHTQRWHAHHHTAGTGQGYQDRFKSFPIQTDEHFLTVARYVERNALRGIGITPGECATRPPFWGEAWVKRMAKRCGMKSPIRLHYLTVTDTKKPWPCPTRNQ